MGNFRLVNDFKASLTDEQKQMAEEWQLTGQTVMYLIIGKTVEGMVSVSDKIKETSASAIKKLQKLGVHVHMLTGDNKFTAKAVADELGLDGYGAGQSGLFVDWDQGRTQSFRRLRIRQLLLTV